MVDLTTVYGAVLVGGTSERMGTDKATVELDGSPLGSRALAALRGAGIETVVLVGATPEQTAALGADALDDLWPGQGPAGGVLTALHGAFLAGKRTAVVLACDLPTVDAAAITRLLETAGTDAASAPIVIPVEDGRRAYPNGVWSLRALPALEARFVDEAHSVHDIIGDTPVDEMPGNGSFVDVDDPGALDEFR